MGRDDTKSWGDDRLLAMLDFKPGNDCDSPLHRGNFMEPDKPGLQKVQNFDAISSVELPTSWRCSKQNSEIGNSLSFRSATNPKAQINFAERSQPVPEQAANAFKQIIDPDAPTPRIVYSANLDSNGEGAATIKSLASALGSNLVGDNQLTSPQGGENARQPAFHLDSALVETINGKNVIAVDGWFTQMDEKANIKMGLHGPLKRYYTGIFYDADGKGTKIDQMYLVADDKDAFVSTKGVFRSSTKSIEWR
ncbi:MAG: hypothetical protein P4L53_05435 [Candidatus Obscuribacterales bacterium]|nr:hypothetical protein [Candidatus Obscuribacterales bacterium]